MSMLDMVSIILPNYNHSVYLKERLDSIFNQTYQNFEVILLDDCSTDGSLNVLEPYKNHPKVSHFIVNTQNSGSPFKQWQKGLKLAKGDYIWIAESDDFCDVNFLETQLKCLETTDVAIAKTKAYSDGGANHEIQHPVFDETKQANALLFCPILNVSSVLFKAELLKNSSDAYYEIFKIIGDRVFYFEYFRDSKMAFNDQTVNYFRRSSSNISNLDNRSLSYYIEYFKEHCRFIDYVESQQPKPSKKTIKQYFRKFYRRIADRVPSQKKWSLAYMRLFFYYKIKILFY